MLLPCSTCDKVVILNVFKTGINDVSLLPVFKMCSWCFQFSLGLVTVHVYFVPCVAFRVHVAGDLNKICLRSRRVAKNFGGGQTAKESQYLNI